MTLLKQLQNHVGGLIRLKKQLYWYGRRGWDDNPGRVCLVLDASTHLPEAHESAWASTTNSSRWWSPAVLLLIDERLHWIWVDEQDIELLK